MFPILYGVPMATNPELLDTHDVAERLGMHVKSIHRMCAEGVFPRPDDIAGHGGTFLWREETLAQWFEWRRKMREAVALRAALEAEATACGAWDWRKNSGARTREALINAQAVSA